MNGFIKLHRSLMDWGWYRDGNTMRVFLHLLLTANWEDSTLMGVTIRRGQAMFGLKSMAEKLLLSERQVRTAIKHLKSTGEVTVKATHSFSVATIVNYSKYQDVPFSGDIPDGIPDRQPDDTQTTTSKNIRNKETDKYAAGAAASLKGFRREARGDAPRGSEWDVPCWNGRSGI